MTIKVYTTPTCPWCKKAKEWLKKNRIKFEELDVVENEEARDAMIEKSGQMGVPVIEIDGQIIVGFDEKKLSELLLKDKEKKKK